MNVFRAIYALMTTPLYLVCEGIKHYATKTLNYNAINAKYVFRSVYVRLLIFLTVKQILDIIRIKNIDTTTLQKST